MNNYKDSDYALNKYSANIVYRFADRIHEVTLADYLADNPGKTEADFLALKSLSDEIYLKQAKDEYTQTYKNSPIEALHGDIAAAVPSPEDALMEKLDAAELSAVRRAKLALAYRIMDKLSEKQRRRYVQYHTQGLTLRQMAAAEGLTHKAIHKSIMGVEKKIKKYIPRE
jgi:DNA-directed RNA polymerase specialized sigma24 family protein